MGGGDCRRKARGKAKRAGQSLQGQCINPGPLYSGVACVAKPCGQVACGGVGYSGVGYCRVVYGGVACGCSFLFLPTIATRMCASTAPPQVGRAGAARELGTMSGVPPRGLLVTPSLGTAFYG